MTLAEQLASDGWAKGLCDEWHRQLLGYTDKHDMVAMYIRGLDFCLSNDYPSNDFIRTHFSGVAEEYGVYVDALGLALVNPRRIIALGSTSGKATISDCSVADVYLKGDSKIELEVYGDAVVTIDVFDRAELSVSVRDRASVYITRYQGANKVHAKSHGDASRLVEVVKPTSTYE